MSASKAIFARLTTAAGVIALVSTRVFTDQADPETPRPFIVYEEGDTEGDDVYGTPTLQYTIVTVACIDDTKAGAVAVADAVMAAVNDQKGTWGGINVEGCFLESKQDDKVTITQGVSRFVRELNFKVWTRP